MSLISCLSSAFFEPSSNNLLEGKVRQGKREEQQHILKPGTSGEHAVKLFQEDHNGYCL